MDRVLVRVFIDGSAQLRQTGQVTDAEVTLHDIALVSPRLVFIPFVLTHTWVCLLISSALIWWTFLLPASSHVITHESRV